MKRTENWGIAHRPVSQRAATGTAETGRFQPEGKLIEEPREQYYLTLSLAVLA